MLQKYVLTLNQVINGRYCVFQVDRLESIQVKKLLYIIIVMVNYPHTRSNSHMRFVIVHLTVIPEPLYRDVSGFDTSRTHPLLCRPILNNVPCP